MRAHHFFLAFAVCFSLLWSSLNSSGFAADPSPPTENRGTISKAEVVFWDTIKESSDPADYLDYLTHFPNGYFVNIARRRAQLPGAERSEPPVIHGTTSVPAPISNYAAGEVGWIAKGYPLLDQPPLRGEPSLSIGSEIWWKGNPNAENGGSFHLYVQGNADYQIKDLEIYAFQVFEDGILELVGRTADRSNFLEGNGGGQFEFETHRTMDSAVICWQHSRKEKIGRIFEAFHLKRFPEGANADGELIGLHSTSNIQNYFRISPSTPRTTEMSEPCLDLADVGGAHPVNAQSRTSTTAPVALGQVYAPYPDLPRPIDTGSVFLNAAAGVSWINDDQKYLSILIENNSPSPIEGVKFFLFEDLENNLELIGHSGNSDFFLNSFTQREFHIGSSEPANRLALCWEHDTENGDGRVFGVIRLTPEDMNGKIISTFAEPDIRTLISYEKTHPDTSHFSIRPNPCISLR